ncbi:MAG: glycosyltransferase family 4 protein [Vicinamibacterales bacterium]
MAPRRLILVVPGEIGTRTGGYEYDRQIIAGLRARGWDVSIVSLPGAYPWPSETDRAEADHALASIPDASLVVGDGLAFGALPGELARHRDRLTLIALVHHPLGLETGLSPEQAAQLDTCERRALASVRMVVVTSRLTVDAVCALGVERRRIGVVEPGTRRAPLAGASSPGAPTRLLCVASVVPRKGHAVLFDALSTLTDLPWRLECVGSTQRDPGLAEALRRQVAIDGLTERIAFVGELEGSALESAYAAADLFVFPTRYEGYGMVVAEALARGIPVVSTPTGAIADLLGGDDPAGRLVPPDHAAALAETLRDLMTDRSALASLRAAALRARDRLPTWAEASRRFESVLDDSAELDDAADQR